MLIGRLPYRQRHLRVHGGALLRDLGILVALVVVAEVTLRIVAPVYGEQLYDREFTRGQPVGLNADGYRGALVPLERHAEELRVLALGDSTSFGTGVAAHESWPAALRSKMDQPGVTVNVINAAMPAASLRELTQDFGQRWRAYEPDIVVLAVSGNMISNAWIRREDPPKQSENGYLESPTRSTLGEAKVRVNRLVRSFCLPSFLVLEWKQLMYAGGLLRHDVNPHAPVGPLLAYGWRQGDLDPSVVDEAWTVLETELDDLARLIREAGARLIVTFTPCRFEISEVLSDNRKAVPRRRLTTIPGERVEAICAKIGVTYVDAVDALRALRRDAEHRGDALYVLGDFNHLDATGHRAVAGAMEVPITSRETSDEHR